MVASCYDLHRYEARQMVGFFYIGRYDNLSLSWQLAKRISPASLSCDTPAIGSSCRLTLKQVGFFVATSLESFMGNRWHATQDKNMRPDIKAKNCPWCGSDSICVDTIKFEHEHLNSWAAQACCHECGAKSPDSDFDAEYGSDLYHQKQDLDIEVERDVVNQAVRVWNYRI